MLTIVCFQGVDMPGGKYCPWHGRGVKRKKLGELGASTLKSAFLLCRYKILRTSYSAGSPTLEPFYCCTNIAQKKLILYFTLRNTEEGIIKVVDTPSLATSGKWI